MADVRPLIRSFAGGELTPEFFGRVDNDAYQTGLALCRNFIVLPHGPVANRAGTQYVNPTKYATRKSRLIDFTYSTTQTMVIEIGHLYMRFHTQGASLVLGSTPAAWNSATAYNQGDLVSYGGFNYYCIAANTNQSPPNLTYWYMEPTNGVYEIPTPYVEADVFGIERVQSSDVLTLTHPNYPPMELRRYGATNWQLVTISFASSLASPTISGVTANTAGGTTNQQGYTYKVSAIGGNNNLDESAPSAASTSVNNNLYLTGNSNTVTWSAVTGATRYNVYRFSNGLYGYLGQTDQLTFTDPSNPAITPDLTKTPPIVNNPFVGVNNYPGAVSYFEQRRDFAGTNNLPQNFWMTRSGTESNLSQSLPTRDSDAIIFRVAARQASRILHIVPLQSLIMLTSSAEYRVTSVNTDALTPTSTSIAPQSYIGASTVQPVIVNNNIIFGAARGGHMRELAYSYQGGGYVTGDLSLRAPHLFDGLNVVDMAYSKAPQPIVWCISTNPSASLLGLTYVPEEQVGAWHHHDTGNGVFESVAVVAEGNVDSPYFVVQRTINGATVRNIERMAARQIVDQSHVFFADCGITYDAGAGNTVTTISGATWLEGQTINILADGAVNPPQVVTGGSFSLAAPAQVVTFGIPITADIQLLPLILEGQQAFGQGNVKDVAKVTLRVYQSSGIFAGPSFSKLKEYKQRTTEVYGAPPMFITDSIDLVVSPAWSQAGTVCVRQTDPLPLTITSMTLDVAVGG